MDPVSYRLLTRNTLKTSCDNATIKETQNGEVYCNKTPGTIIIIEAFITRARSAWWPNLRRGVSSALFCSLAVLDPRVGHTMDVLYPFIPVLCHSDWLFLGESRPRLVVHPGRVWPYSSAFLALSLSLGNSLVSSWCDHSMLASLLWRCLTVPSLLQYC